MQRSATPTIHSVSLCAHCAHECVCDRIVCLSVRIVCAMCVLRIIIVALPGFNRSIFNQYRTGRETGRGRGTRWVAWPSSVWVSWREEGGHCSAGRPTVLQAFTSLMHSMQSRNKCCLPWRKGSRSSWEERERKEGGEREGSGSAGKCSLRSNCRAT